MFFSIRHSLGTPIGSACCTAAGMTGRADPGSPTSEGCIREAIPDGMPRIEVGGGPSAVPLAPDGTSEPPALGRKRGEG